MVTWVYIRVSDFQQIHVQLNLRKKSRTHVSQQKWRGLIISPSITNSAHVNDQTMEAVEVGVVPIFLGALVLP